MNTVLVLVGLAELAALSMVLALTDANVAARKARGSARAAGVQETLRALFAHINTLGNPDLQLVEYTTTGAADVVIANVACRLYAWYMKKPTASTVNAWLKGSDHATVAGVAGDVVHFLIGTGGGGREYCPIWADGISLATGLTIASHTTVGGATDSAAADSASGFIIIGAA